MDNWHLDSDQVIMIVEIDSELVVHFEVFAHWVLLQYLELTKRNKMRFEIYVTYLHILNEVMIGDYLVFVEEHQNAHLVSTDAHFVALGPVVSDLRSDFSVSLVELPVKLSTRKLAQIILFENAHTLLNLRRNLDDIDLL